MRRIRTLWAGGTLAFCVGSSSLCAQTENQDQSEGQVPAVATVQTGHQKPNDSQALPDDTIATDSGAAEPQLDAEVKSPAADLKADILKEATEPKEAVEPHPAAQQPVRQAASPATVKANLGRFALTFNDLKFDQDKGEAFNRNLLTSKINSYHGGKVKIRGYIRPNFKQSGITKFIFVRDNKECCFGPQAAIFDNILVRLERGESTNFTVRPITVEGDFVLKEYYGDNGEVWSLYRMYNAEVK